MLDLDYSEDAEAETDMNVVMNDAGHFVEIQGTAEGHAFRPDELEAMLRLARQGIQCIIEKQRSVLKGE
jgi:ribonuclease PH